jgi:DNA-binding transcriptional ArsR family regulator
MKKPSLASATSGRSKGVDPFAGIDLRQVSDRLRALAHPDRLRLIGILLQEELPVGELALRIGVPQPQVSGHLRILQGKGMLACRRDGHRMHYTVATPALSDICTCIRTHFGTCKVGGAR